MSMAWVAVGSVVAGGVMNYVAGEKASSSTNRATDAASAATLYGIDAQMDQFDQTMELFKPYWEAGVEGLKKLEDTKPGADAPTMPSTTIDFEFDPNDKMYKIQQEEGETAINRALSARGMTNSRPGINALTDFNTKLIAQETDKQYGRAVDKYGRDTASAIDTFNIENKLAGQEYGKWLDIVKTGAGAAGGAGAASTQTGQGVASSYNALANTQFKGGIAQGQIKAEQINNLGKMPVNAIAGYDYANKNFG